MVVGPYNDKGELWSCDEVDMCNGHFSKDGSYVYTATTTWPYTVGCFGPTLKKHEFKPSCSPNACSDASTLALSIASALITSYLF